MAKKTKSPLKDRPLRYVAQSSDEAIEDLLTERVIMYLTVAGMFLVMAIWEWIRYFSPLNHPPYLSTFIATIVIPICAYKLVQKYKILQRYKLGRDGERAVGQYLESTKESGSYVYHDIFGDNFNIDHVLISPKGIFVIETKTYSKPVKGEAKINYDGTKILINGSEPMTNALVQAKAGACHIKEILKESTGKDFIPFPVVLYPGWYVSGDGNRKGEAWVLNPKAFTSFIEKQTNKLSNDDVKLASYHLSRHIRTLVSN